MNRRIVLKSNIHYLCPFFWFVANLSWPLWNFFHYNWLWISIHFKFSVVLTLLLSKITRQLHEKQENFSGIWFFFFKFIIYLRSNFKFPLNNSQKSQSKKIHIWSDELKLITTVLVILWFGKRISDLATTDAHRATEII